MSGFSRIMRSAGVIGVSTLLSRVLGLVRDIVMSSTFGTGPVADAFYVAFMIPALLRRLVGEGSLTVAFIPVFTKFRQRYGEEKSRLLLSSFWTLMTIVLAVLVLLGILFSEDIVHLFTNPVFRAERQKFALTVLMTRQMFPYLFLIGLTALAMGILNSYKHFFAPAFHPVLLNVSWISAVLLLNHRFEQVGLSVVIGVLVGGVLQLGLQIYYLRKLKIVPLPRFNFRHPAIRRIGMLMLPSTLAVGVVQINVLISTWFITAWDGARTQMFYANRLTEFPYAIFSLAIATAILPTLSEHAGNKDMKALRDTLGRGLRMTAFVIIPASIGLAVVARPLIHIAFEHGKFTANDTMLTASMVGMFCVGLWAVAFLRIVVQVFYAMEDMVTPVWAAAIGMAVNAFACGYLTPRFARMGVPLAISLSTIVNFSILWLRMPKRAGKLLNAALLKTLGVALLGSVPMAAVALWLGSLPVWEREGALPEKLGLLIAMVSAGAILFAAVTWVCKSPELTEVLALFRRKIKRSETS